jgi:PEP-CTERM motif
MRLGRLFISFSVLMFSLLLASSAFADTVRMHYLGGSGGGPDPVYPYRFHINNSPTVTDLICDSFNNSVKIGESWSATVTPFLQATGLFGATTSLDYKAAGLIFKSMLGGTLTASQAQWSIWGLFASNAKKQPTFKSVGAGAIETEYLTLAATAKNSAFSGLLLYTPIAGTQTWTSGGLPQEFIGYSPVPEPSSLILLGSGLIALAGTMRRKFAKI